MIASDSWLIGVGLATAASALSNLGVNLQKLAHKCHSRPGSTERVYRESLWIWGLALLATGSLLDFVALGFAPQSLIAPLGALTLVFNIVFAPILLREPCRRRDCQAIGVIVAGSVLAVLNASHSDVLHTIPALLALFTRPAFVAYAATMLAIVIMMLLLIHHFETMRIAADSEQHHSGGDPRARRRAYKDVVRYHMILYPTVAGLIGSQNIMFAKCTAELVINWTGRGVPIFTLWPTYAIAAALACTIMGQLHWLNAGLSRFDSSYVLPVFQTTWLLASVVTGMIFFDEILNVSAAEAGSFIIGLVAVVLGVAMLTPSRSEANIDGDEDAGPLLSAKGSTRMKSCEMTAFAMVTISNFSSMYISLQTFSDNDRKQQLSSREFLEGLRVEDPC